MNKISKPRKKRKGNDLNASFEDDIPVKSVKRKSKLIILIFAICIYIYNYCH